MNKVQGLIQLGVVLVCCQMAVPVARGEAGGTANGNDLALFFSEAKSDTERKALVAAAVEKQHFFRYLKITERVDSVEDRNPIVRLTTLEPSSGYSVKFIVRKTMSLEVLKRDPPCKVGDTIAVTGVVRSVDKTTKNIILNPVIVRLRDRAAPKAGKEMLYEIDPSAIVYSFTGGKFPVNVSKRDADLLSREAEIMGSRGKNGWAEYLRDEIEKRDKAANAARDKLDIYKRKDAVEETPEEGDAPATPAMPAQSVITEDEN